MGGRGRGRGAVGWEGVSSPVACKAAAVGLFLGTEAPLCLTPDGKNHCFLFMVCGYYFCSVAGG